MWKHCETSEPIKEEKSSKHDGLNTSSHDPALQLHTHARTLATAWTNQSGTYLFGRLAENIPDTPTTPQAMTQNCDDAH